MSGKPGFSLILAYARGILALNRDAWAGIAQHRTMLCTTALQAAALAGSAIAPMTLSQVSQGGGQSTARVQD